MSETLSKDFIENIKDVMGPDVTKFIDPESVKKDLGDEMKKDLDAEMQALKDDKEMSSIEKRVKISLLKLKTNVLAPLFGRNKNESEKKEERTSSAKIENYKDITNDPTLLAMADGPSIDYMKDATFQMYLLNLEEKNGLPYHMMRQLMFAESGWQLYDSSREIIHSKKPNGERIAAWLFAFTPDTAKVYIKKLWYEEKDYELIYKNPLIGAQASALLLKDRFDAWDDIVNNLAHYNAGPGTAGGKKITVENFFDLPAETENYVVKIGDKMLQDIGINSWLSKEEIKNPHKINKARLGTFLDLVNNTPLTKEEIKHKEVIPTWPEIVAKNMNEITGFGDSSMEWLKTVGIKNAESFVGLSTNDLLKKLEPESKDKENRVIIDEIHKGKSCIVAAGYNDIAGNNLANYKENLIKIIDKISPTQAILTTLYHNGASNTPSDKVDEANTIIRALAKLKNIPLIDVEKDNTVAINDLAEDKLHLNGTGYKKIYDHIKETVETKVAA